jgi:hypothetical protein
MHAPSALSLVAVTPSPGTGSGAATVIGFALIATYLAGLVWLHRRRRRRRRPPRDAATASPVAAHRPPVTTPPAEAVSVAPGAEATPRIAMPEPDRPTAAPPTIRLEAAALEPLGACLECSRRVAVAEARVADALARLPRERWLVERYVLVGGLRVPFLVLGETGVFALWGLDQTPGWGDLPVVNRAGDAVQALLPDYPGQVHVGLCRAFDPINPRWWYASESGCGAWLLGVNWLERWLAHFEDGGGLGDGDVARAAELARPRWRPRPTGSSLPTTPNVG